MADVVDKLLTSDEAAANASSSQRSEAISSLMATWSNYERASGQDSRTAAELAALVDLLVQLLHQLQAVLVALPDLAQRLQPQLLRLEGSLQEMQAVCRRQLEGQATSGRFEWVDGALTRAIENGSWVLLDNANLCNPTVLDRLNPLLEPGGVLYLNECGHVNGAPRIIRPHPNFRLILALDSAHGDVSRSMRNRGIELFMLPQHDQRRLGSSQQLPAALALPLASSGLEDVEGVLASEGVVGGPLLAAMAAAHHSVVHQASAAHRRPPSLREVRNWGAISAALVQRGRPLAQALWTGWMAVYIKGQASNDELVALAQVTFLQVCDQLSIAAPAEALAPALGAGSDAHGSLKTAVVQPKASPWPDQLLRPCVWPDRLQAAHLAHDALLGGVRRDASLLTFLLAQHLAAHVDVDSDHSFDVLGHRVVSLPHASLSVDLKGAADHLMDHAGVQHKADSRQLLLLSWHAAIRYALRAATSPNADGAVRQLLLNAVVTDVQTTCSATQVEFPTGSIADNLRHLVAGMLNHAVLQSLSASSHGSVEPGADGSVEPGADVLLLVAASISQSACEQAAQQSAGICVARGTASAYQNSFWRYSRPQERARTAAEHGCIDWLYPAFAGLAEFEALALQPEAMGLASEMLHQVINPSLSFEMLAT